MWRTAVLIGVLFGFGLSYVLYRRGRPGWAACLLAASGLALRLFVAGSDQFLHPWDERYHALVAKHLMEHPLRPTLYERPLLPYDYTNWSGNHVWLHKPPLTLWLSALSMKLFGVGEVAMRLPSILLSALAVLLTYGTGALLFDRRTGLLAAFLHAINNHIIGLSAGRVMLDHVDAVFLFVVELGIFLAALYAKTRRSSILILTGVTMGLAVLTKWLLGLIVLPVLVLLLWDTGHLARMIRATFGALAIAVIVFMPWQIYIHLAFPAEAAWESAYNTKHFFVPVEGHAQPRLYHFTMMATIFGRFVYIPLGWFLYRFFKSSFDPARWAVLAWVAGPYLFFTLAATKLPSYCIISAPAVFLIIASFWLWLVDAVRAGTTRLRSAGALVLLLLLLFLPVRDGLSFFQSPEEPPGWANELKSLTVRSGDSSSSSSGGGGNLNYVLFGVEHYLEAMFYTPFTAYPHLPSSAEVERLKAAGYRPAILRDGRIEELERAGN